MNRLQDFDPEGLDVSCIATVTDVRFHSVIPHADVDAGELEEPIVVLVILLKTDPVSRGSSCP